MSDEASVEKLSVYPVTLNPTQLNDVILEKLALLAPKFKMLLEDFSQFRQEITDNRVRWDVIAKYSKSG